MTAIQPQRPSLGRQYKPDPRDRAFALTRTKLQQLVRAEALTPRKLPWKIKPSLDQGNTSECVIHALAHNLQAAPIWHSLGWSRAKLTELYQRAQAIDGFGPRHDGTTARAACTIAREEGLITEYLWIYDEETLKAHLHQRGTVMMGTDWFTSMFDTGARGYLEPKGIVEGGHETLVRWYYPETHRLYPDTYECQNSWGSSWGDQGRFRLKAETLRYLVFALNGDLCLPSESAIVRPKEVAA